MTQPLLSFVLFGRNDNYTPDFLYRLSTTINFLAYSANIASQLEAVEIIVVDWASDVQLKHALVLSEIGAQITKFLYVTPAIAEQYADTGIPGNVCMNIGLRRANGKLVAVSGAEILVPASTITSLCNIVLGCSPITEYQNFLFSCGRYRLPAEWVMTQPTVEQWQDYLLLNSWQIPQEPGRGSFLTGNAGMFLIPREMLHETQGLLEELDPLWGWNDVEYTMRILAKYSCIDLNSSGVTIYDMEHFKFAGERNHIIKKTPPRLLAESFKCNGNNWGAGHLKFESESASGKNERVRRQAMLEKITIDKETINDEQFRLFSLWLANYVYVTPSDNEALTTAVLFQYLSTRNVLFYKEFGINKGISFYLVSYLFKHTTLVGIDEWQMGGGDFGPEHIAYNLTTPGMMHKGHVRLTNKLLRASYKARNRKVESAIAQNGLTVYRLDAEDTVDTVGFELKDHEGDIIIIGANADTIGQQLATDKTLYLLADNIVLLTKEILTSVIDKEKVQKHAQELLYLYRHGVDLSALPLTHIMPKLNEIKNNDIVLWSESLAKIELMWPHLHNNIAAIICDEIDQVKYKGVSVICTDQIDDDNNVYLLRI